jgi:cytidylate kinase
VAGRLSPASICRSDEAVAGLASTAALDVNGSVIINGHDVTQAIRTPEIDRSAAIVARHPKVRAVLVQRQRTYGEAGGIVMEGRDIGSVVFPQADVKVYLDATPEERARRRAHDDSARHRRLTSPSPSSPRNSQPATHPIGPDRFHR